MSTTHDDSDDRELSTDSDHEPPAKTSIADAAYSRLRWFHYEPNPDPDWFYTDADVTPADIRAASDAGTMFLWIDPADGERYLRCEDAPRLDEWR